MPEISSGYLCPLNDEMMRMKRYFALIPVLFLLVQSAAQKNPAKKVSNKVKPAITVPEKALNFIAMGDWGRNGEYNQKEVALQMGITAKDAAAWH